MREVYTNFFDSASVVYAEQIRILDKQNGYQSFIFYSIRKETDLGEQQQTVGMIEMLMQPFEEVLAIDHGEVTEDHTTFKLDNQGDLTLGGNPSNQYLMVLHNNLTSTSGLTMCGYQEVLSSTNSQKCEQLPTGQYSLGPFERETFSCDSQEEDSARSKWICAIHKVEPEPPSIISYVVYFSVGITAFLFICSLVCYGCHRYKMTRHADHLLNSQVNQIRARQQAQPERPLEPIEQAALDQQRQLAAYKLLEKKLIPLKYKQSLNKESQPTCAVCVEEFKASTVVRETPCKHVFHDDCLMKWVKQKIEDPECPVCRALIKFD